jgi:hypothetical protein
MRICMGRAMMAPHLYVSVYLKATEMRIAHVQETMLKMLQM